MGMDQHNRGTMRPLLLGATGRTGRALLDQALDRGHKVTAFVRSPDKLGAPRDGLIVQKGTPQKLDALCAALTGHDAVLSALGPPGLGATTILQECAQSTVAAMRSTGVRRLLIVSAAMLFEDAGLLSWFLRTTLLRNVAKDSRAMERVVMESDLDWTIARPPRLTHDGLTGHYAVEEGRLPRGGRAVGRADVAHFLLEELQHRAHLKRIVGMAAG
jgi:putative NADH-flavin reductase